MNYSMLRYLSLHHLKEEMWLSFMLSLNAWFCHFNSEWLMRFFGDIILFSEPHLMTFPFISLHYSSWRASRNVQEGASAQVFGTSRSGQNDVLIILSI
jgi:hypothetical protein